MVPSVYKRGDGVLRDLGMFCQAHASTVLLIGGKQALEAVREPILESLHRYNLKVVGPEWYGGECTYRNIERISQLAHKSEAGLLIAVGGGRALDTGKAVAYRNHIPCVTVPTIAATCAAFTPLSIINDENGVYIENSPRSACPAAVFVDVEVILRAPQRWLFAGMGDTLAKWYELRATGSKIPATSWTLGGINNGKICYDIIKKFGPGAKVAMDEGKVNEALENVIDAIIFYAGMSSILGGEKCRGAAAHSIYFGFTNIPAAHSFGHGLLVGFGNLCLLALERRGEAEILEEVKLAKSCGVPTTLAEIAAMSDDDIQRVAEVAVAAKDMGNMPQAINNQQVVEAIYLVDRLGRTVSS
ncbi:glycerol dehydrogenase [Peptococcaceae bacterium CEB3]|nr:glycerol dehydrogenase [Peptococcaceae bacterium CEB3]